MKKLFFLLIAAHVYGTDVGWELLTSMDYSTTPPTFTTPLISANTAQTTFSIVVAQVEGNHFEINAQVCDGSGNCTTSVISGSGAFPISESPTLYVTKDGKAVVVWLNDANITYNIYDSNFGGWLATPITLTNDPNANGLQVFGSYHSNTPLFLFYSTLNTGTNRTEINYFQLTSFASAGGTWIGPSTLTTASSTTELLQTPTGKFTDDGTFGAAIWSRFDPSASPVTSSIEVSQCVSGVFGSTVVIASSTAPTNVLVLPTVTVPSDGSNNTYGSYTGYNYHQVLSSDPHQSYQCYSFCLPFPGSPTTQLLTPPLLVSGAIDFSTITSANTYPAILTQTVAASGTTTPVATIANYTNQNSGSPGKSDLICFSGASGCNLNLIKSLYHNSSSAISSLDATIGILPYTTANQQTVLLSFTLQTTGFVNLYAQSFDIDQTTGVISSIQQNPTLLLENVADYRKTATPNVGYIGAASGSAPMMAAVAGANGLSWALAGKPALYNTYRTIQVFPAILPPASVTGKQKTCRFLVDSELYNVIQWSPSPTPNIVSYIILRNGVQIATVPGYKDEYQDHNREKGVIYTYSVIAVDPQGNQSTAATVTIP